MNYFFPGFYQILKKNYFQGIIIFLLLFFPVIFLIKLKLYSLPDETSLLLLTAGVFTSGIIWHIIYIINCKTSCHLTHMTNDELYEAGRMAYLKQNYELALIYFESLKKVSPDDIDVFYQLGRTYLQVNRKKEALNLLNRYLKSSRKNKKWEKEAEDLLEENK